MNDFNPLLVRSGLPPFDRICPEHIRPAADEFLGECRRILEHLESVSDPDWCSLFEPLEKIDLLFEYGWSPVGHLLSVANSDELRRAHEETLPDIVEFGLRLRQSDVFYQLLCRIRDSEQWNTISEAQRRIIRRSIQSAEQSGIGLEGIQRERFNEIEQRLSHLATQFSNHVLDATKTCWLDLTDPESVSGLPLSLRRRMAAAWSNAEENREKPSTSPESGPWRVTLDQPTFGPFMEHCADRNLREKLYRMYITRASAEPWDNSGLIAEILTLRREQSELLGFSTYADLSMSRKMAGTVCTVRDMFDRLLAASHGVAQKELEELTEFAQAQGHHGRLSHWDVAYWAERLRESRFSFTDEELRPFFSFERVLAGLFEICHVLFGITVRPADGKAPIWNPDVRYFEVLNEQGSLIAAFYLDPYSRPANKRGGAWMADCITRSVRQDGVRLPVAHLICNSTPPVNETPSLMTFREVETLFHEFGHGLQHMLTTVDFRDAAGISGIEWDAVELPSQFMENWCYHRDTLMKMAVHYSTGEQMSEELFQKLLAARNYRAASQMLRQLQLGMSDMELHASWVPEGNETPFDAERRISEKTSLLPPLPENRFLCSFQHIFSGGYAAGYYSYKWAEVLSADAFSAFQEAGTENLTETAMIGRRFRDTVLAQGGSRHPMEIFEEFRGRKPDPAALLRQCGLLKADC
jgi:oligopeptidase A